MKAPGRLELHSFLTPALDGGKWPALTSDRFDPKEKTTFGFQNRSGRFGERRNLSSLQRI
jgi:hypothetical protein